MIFVFGSNKRGIHGAGAAKYAYQNHGARLGVGEGMAGHTYALPTKHTPSKNMTLEEIRKSVNTFLEYAGTHSGLLFQVTQIGCGYGGWTKKDIAPLFVKGSVSLRNCYFDRAWKDLLPIGVHFWGTF